MRRCWKGEEEKNARMVQLRSHHVSPDPTKYNEQGIPRNSQGPPDKGWGFWRICKTTDDPSLKRKKLDLSAVVHSGKRRDENGNVHPRRLLLTRSTCILHSLDCHSFFPLFLRYAKSKVKSRVPFALLPYELQAQLHARVDCTESRWVSRMSQEV